MPRSAVLHFNIARERTSLVPGTQIRGSSHAQVFSSQKALPEQQFPGISALSRQYLFFELVVWQSIGWQTTGEYPKCFVFLTSIWEEGGGGFLIKDLAEGSTLIEAENKWTSDRTHSQYNKWHAGLWYKTQFVVTGLNRKAKQLCWWLKTLYK